MKVIKPLLTILKEEERVLESGKVLKIFTKDRTATAIARLAQEV